MLELACSTPSRFDRLLDRVTEARDPSLSMHLFGYANMGGKDCPLGEDYTAVLIDRLLKEEKSKPRKVIREAIQWHVFHEHARKWSPKPYEESAAAKVRAFSRRDEEDDRWYGVVQAIYAPRFPEAAAEMWRAIREDAEKTDGLLIIGAFETSFNRNNEGPWPYRRQFLKECLQFLKQARDLENPWAASWMVRRGFQNFALNGHLNSAQVLEWEEALLETASKARSQDHRGAALASLVALGSRRVIPHLNEWLHQDLKDSTIEDFLQDISEARIDRGELEAKITDPRIRAGLTVRREFNNRFSGDGAAAASYLLEVLKTEPEPEMRKEALHRLAYWLRDDDRDANEGLPQGMSNRLDLLEIVLADPSPQVRKVLVRAFDRSKEDRSNLGPDRRAQIQKLVDSVK